MVAVALVLAAACSDTATPADPPAATPSALGGEGTAEREPPARRMTLVERTIAADLTGRLSENGMTVDYLDCPEFDDRRRPQNVTCRGYVAGVVADVHVRLWGPPEDLKYDAALGEDILATSNLVHLLATEGYHRIDCGDRPAYRSTVGAQIVCSVTRGDRQRYVVATVTTETGKVEISDY